MTKPLKVVHYVNQFFGGIGGEDKANVPVEVREGPVGPGRVLEQLLGDQGSVVSTIICGDNYVNESREAAIDVVSGYLSEAKPDVVIAGPAFDAGRYGLACGAVCQAAQAIGIPGVTAMHRDNPGVVTYKRDAIIVPTSSNAAEMKEALSRVVPIAIKLGTGQDLLPAADEGYIPRGNRQVVRREEPGYKRAVDMLAAKLRGEPVRSEVPFELPERVPPAPPVADLSRATIALISTGGLTPKGNPDRQTSGNPDRYFTYDVEGLESLVSDEWEAFHAGYYNKLSSDNPNYVMPLSYMRAFEREGVVGKTHPIIFTLPGVSTPVDKSRTFGKQIAKELADSGVDGCLLVAT